MDAMFMPHSVSESEAQAATQLVVFSIDVKNVLQKIKKNV